MYHSNERTYSEFERPEEHQLGNDRASSEPEKRLFEESDTRAVNPDSIFPVGIVFESEDFNDKGESQYKDIYAVPLMSYQVMQQLEGRLLDYVDATFMEKDQREAQKRVMRKVLWGYHKELKDARESTFKVSKEVKE